MTELEIKIPKLEEKKEDIDLYAALCQALTQLEEANAVIKSYQCYDDSAFGKASAYCKKWDVK